jgi:cyclopropane fatty-acyl-phospholipid synthase-like methyltransferase
MHYRDKLYSEYVSKYKELNEPVCSTTLERAANFIKKTIIVPFFPKDRNIRLLDLGCGYGSFLYACAQSGYRNLMGVDNSPEQVALAEKLGIREIGEIIQKNIFEFLREVKVEFDVITAIDVLEHFTKEEIMILLPLIYDALKPGGLFVIRSVNGESPFMGRWLYADFTHELCFTRMSIRQLLLSAGFYEVRCFEVPPLVHSFMSGVRAFLWRIIDSFFRFCVVVEGGDWRDRPIFSYNIIAVGSKLVGINHRLQTIEK